VRQCDEVIVAVLDLAKPEIARVCTVKGPDDRVEVCEDLDIVLEVIELRAFVGTAFGDCCAKRVFVFAVYACGMVNFESAVVCVPVLNTQNATGSLYQWQRNLHSSRISTTTTKTPLMIRCSILMETTLIGQTLLLGKMPKIGHVPDSARIVGRDQEIRDVAPNSDRSFRAIRRTT